MVGAPLSNVTSVYGSETLVRYGAAYKCEYTGSQQCDIINIDNIRKPCKFLFSNINPCFKLYITFITHLIF